MRTLSDARGPAPSVGPLAHLAVRGSHREIGRQIGEATRDIVHATIAHYVDAYPRIAGLTFAQAEIQAQVYLAKAAEHMPQFVAELRGIAEGADVEVMPLLVLHCGEEFTAEADVRPHAVGCTAVGVSDGGRHVVGHNMDWYAADVDKNVILDMTLPDGTRIVTVHGAPYLPILGVSSHGFAYVGNSVPSTDNQVGVPNMFVRRWVLEARSLAEAQERACFTARARGSNHFLGHADGTLLTLETSATADAVIHGQGHLAHTNHYVAAKMHKYGAAPAQESLDRLARAERLLAEGPATGEDAIDLVARVLRDHAHAPESICGHPQDSLPAAERIMTVHSMICDLDERRVYVRSGSPCEGPYQCIQL